MPTIIIPPGEHDDTRRIEIRRQPVGDPAFPPTYLDRETGLLAADGTSADGVLEGSPDPMELSSSADISVEVVSPGSTPTVSLTLSDETPMPVAATGSAGAGEQASRDTHQHAGVGSFAKTGGTLHYGAVSIDEGEGIGIADNGDGSFEIDTISHVSDDTPQDVGSSGAAGVGADVSRKDHVHRGVTSITHDDAAYGAVSLIEGDNVTITQADGAFTIAADNTVVGLSDDNPESVADTAGPGTDETASRSDHVHVGVTSLTKTGGTPRSGALTLTEGDNVTITDNGNGTITIAAADTDTVITVSVSDGLVVDHVENNYEIDPDWYANFPAAVGAEPAVGDISKIVKANHVHQGVTSLTVPEGTARYGAITIAAGDLYLVVTDETGEGTPQFEVAIGEGSHLLNSILVNSGTVPTNPTSNEAVWELKLLGEEHGILAVIPVGTSDTISLWADYGDEAPPAVAASGAVGTSPQLAREDHTHAGVSSLTKTSGTPRTGALTLTEGANVSITDNGDGTITIAATDNDTQLDLADEAPPAVAASGAVGTDGAAAREDHTHAGVTSLTKTGGTPRAGALTLTQGSNMTITDNGDGTISLASSGGAGITDGVNVGDIAVWDGDSWEPSDVFSDAFDTPLTNDSADDYILLVWDSTKEQFGHNVGQYSPSVGVPDPRVWASEYGMVPKWGDPWIEWDWFMPLDIACAVGSIMFRQEEGEAPEYGWNALVPTEDSILMNLSGVTDWFSLADYLQAEFGESAGLLAYDGAGGLYLEDLPA